MGIALLCVGVVCAAYGLLMAVLYPAGGFFLVWLGVGLALVLAWRFERARAAVCAVLVAGLLVVGALSAKILGAASLRPPDRLDALVVLGAGLLPDGSPSEALRFRLDAAVEYLEENPSTTCVVSGGRGVGEVRAEAEAMEDYLVARGVDARRITKEGSSRTTVENIRNSAELLAPGSSVGVVTNDFHLCRALLLAEGNGLPGAYGLAARSNPLYLPNAVLRECAAIVKDVLVGNA